MKLAGVEFSIEEILLCAALAAFFGMIFVGAWQFSADSAMFPLMLSVPALFLLVLYVCQGALPGSVQRAISSNDRFAIGKTPESVKTEDGHAQAGTDGRVYFIFAYTAAFSVAAWALGFYVAAVLAIGLYVARTRSEIGSIPKVAAILAVIAFGMIYTFDSAFGHYYADGALLSFR